MAINSDLDTVQSLVLRGPRRRHARHIALSIDLDNAAQAKRRLAQYAVKISFGAELPVAEAPIYSIGFTAAGLTALGVAPNELDTFPLDFRQGPIVRSAFLGDTHHNHPDTWLEPFRSNPQYPIHAVATIFHDGPTEKHDGPTEKPGDPTAIDWGDYLTEIDCAHLSGEHLDGGTEWFGYADGVSQPKIDGAAKTAGDTPPGEFILGHPSELGDVSLRWRVPGTQCKPDERVGWNGSFAALRIMRQDVGGFNTFLAEQREPAQVAAWICGRRRACDAEHDFGLPPTDAAGAPDFANDLDGAQCPLGSHVRRSNPRNGRMTGRGVHSRRVLRRGIPYEVTRGEEVEQGLIGLFVCANLSAQYEALLTDWIHVGVQDPRISGTNDPLIGNHAGGTGTFRHGGHEFAVPQFVYTRGVSYLFLPGQHGLARLLRPATIGS